VLRLIVISLKGEQGGSYLQKVPIQKAFAVNYNMLEHCSNSITNATKIELSYACQTGEFRIKDVMKQLKGKIP
jgi:hypothetical protein